jgi:uncharacterized membrane protein
MSNYRQELRKRKSRHILRQKITTWIGLLILIGGYALLAVSPETPSDWLMIRVFAGFGALMVGFVIAILPILKRITRGDEY